MCLSTVILTAKMQCRPARGVADLCRAVSPVEIRGRLGLDKAAAAVIRAPARRRARCWGIVQR